MLKRFVCLAVICAAVLLAAAAHADNYIGGDPVVIEDGNLELGLSSQAGTLVFHDGSGNTVTIDLGTVTTWRWTLPDNAGTANYLVYDDGNGNWGYVDPDTVGTNYWQRISSVISPATANDTLQVVTSSDAAGDFQSSLSTGSGGYALLAAQTYAGSIEHYGLLCTLNAANTHNLAYSLKSEARSFLGAWADFDEQGSTPDPPDTGDWRMYFKSDGLYYLEDDDTEVGPLGAGGGGAPVDATYITQTANGTLTNEQAMGALATGMLKNTTTTGVLSIASEGTDYYAPGGTDVAVADGGTGASTAAGARSNLAVAPNDATYVVASLDSGLSAELVLTPGAGLAAATIGVGTLTLDLDAYVYKKELQIDAFEAAPMGGSMIMGRCIIPASFASMDLVDVVVGNNSIATGTPSGTSTYSLTRNRSGTTADMLSTDVSLDYDEYWASDGVIDTSNDDVQEGDMVELVNVTVCTYSTMPPIGIHCTMIFAKASP